MTWKYTVYVVLLLLFGACSKGKHTEKAETKEEVKSTEQVESKTIAVLNFEELQKRLSERDDQLLVVNFWATWCPPCVAEMPGMQELYESYGDRVEFVFVARDEHDRVLKFMDRKNLSVPIYYERTAPPEELKTSSLPTTYLIDPQGTIRIDKVGAADWNSKKVRGLLDELIP